MQVVHASIYDTHHIGASTLQATEEVGDEVVRIVKHYQLSGTVLNCVNLAHQSAATHLLVVRHADQVGVLAGVLDALRANDINVQEMENIIFEGASAAVARIRLQSPPDSEVLQRIGEAEHVLAVQLLTLNEH